MRAAVVAEAPRGAEWLAVGPESLRAAAAPLVEMRRAEGLAAAYVSLESAIDTCGFGRYGAGAISNLVRAVRPKYLLLVGDTTYDYLDREGKGVDPMVPSLLMPVHNMREADASSLYGDPDGDGVPEVAVGRLPVRTADDLARLVAKIVGWEREASEFAGVLVADAFSTCTDFAASQAEIARSHPEVAWTELYVGVHGTKTGVRGALTAAVNAGADLVAYQGHGSMGGLSSGPCVLDTAEARRWTGVAAVCMATCWGAFIRSNTVEPVALAEVLLRGEAGSPLVVGSSTTASHGAQHELLDLFLDEALAGGRAGDALVSAKAGLGARLSEMRTEEAREDAVSVIRGYIVLGDPAMRLVMPAADGRGAGP